jgi:hypothetical protein
MPGRHFTPFPLALGASPIVVASVMAALAGPATAPETSGARGLDAGVATLPDKVKITFITVPVVNAEILFQRRRLGVIDARKKKPLVVERLRDSGPMDVVVRAEGFLPVHTRAYTFTDSKVTVKLTPLAEKHTLFGYRQLLPIDGGIGQDARPGTPRDGGVPPDAGAGRAF